MKAPIKSSLQPDVMEKLYKVYREILFPTQAHWKNMPLPTDLQNSKNVHTYNSLRFPAKLNTNGSKTPTALIIFFTNCNYNNSTRVCIFFLKCMPNDHVKTLCKVSQKRLQEFCSAYDTNSTYIA